MDGVNQPIPGDYAVEIAVMQEMGWSWSAYCEAPADLVDEIVMRMEARARWQETKRKEQGG